MTLPDDKPTRKQRFNAALALAGLTSTHFRTEIHVVSSQHLNEVLNGDRDGGPELNAAIDGLIAKYLPPTRRMKYKIARHRDSHILNQVTA